MTRTLYLLSLLAFTFGVGCSTPEPGPDGSELPPPATSDRAQRDSARVAQLVISYFGYLDRGTPYRALELFFPDSIPVATPSDGLIMEGRSHEAQLEIDRDMELADFNRILLLRRVTSELLESSFRETWILHARLADEDSTKLERTFHVIQPLGNDSRFLGRMMPELAEINP